MPSSPGAQYLRDDSFLEVQQIAVGVDVVNLAVTDV